MTSPLHKPYECLVMSLAFACPYGEAIKNCPMEPYRKLPMQDRMNEVAQMDNELQKHIYLSHRLCLARREGKPVEMVKLGMRKLTTMLRSKKK